MTQKLKDPSKPAGYVFPDDVNEDGSATTNDGRKLKSARTNPWYVLATIYGEHEPGTYFGEREVKVITKNRQVWNAWACAAIDRDRWSELAKEMGLSVREFEYLDAAKQGEVLERFRARMGDDDAKLPDPREGVDFSETYFTNPLWFRKYVVYGWANFTSATVSGRADFTSATFSGEADFTSAAFTGEAYFISATFSDWANFISATFSGWANFTYATFSGWASFTYATFVDEADFTSATFSHVIDFHSSKFKAMTDFSEARFQKFVPAFHGAAIFDDTEFTLLDDHSMHWPPIPKAADLEGTRNQRRQEADRLARDQKSAYNRLRLFMNQSLQTESEQFFHRREMACKKVLEGKFMFGVYWLYEKLSDYGYSVKTPAECLLLNVIVGWDVFMIFLSDFYEPQSVHPIANGVGLSFANVFPFFGFGRRFVTDGFYQDLGPWVTLFSSLQTVFGFLFLFLFGLGLRSRFRLR